MTILTVARFRELLLSLYLREVLSYNRRTGEFRWRVARRRVKSGDVAGYVHPNGYRYIGIDGRMYQASRLAWLYTKGRWPEAEIDHKNGNRGDNRLTNLRDVSRSGNQQNQHRARSNSKTRFLGVSPIRKKFIAQIRVEGGRHYLGIFTTAEAAHTAYVAAKRKLHPTCTI